MYIIEQTPTHAIVSFERVVDDDGNVLSQRTSVQVKFDFLGNGMQDLAPLFSGPVWSTFIWIRSVSLLCSYLETNCATIVQGKTVCELGCGVGIPGLCASFLGARSVVFTDRDDDLKCITKFVKQTNDGITNPSCKLAVVPFDWSVTASYTAERVQVILACECISIDVYGRESLQHLFQAIETVAERNRPVHVLICSCRRAGDGLDEFLEMLKPLCLHLTLAAQAQDAELYEACILVK